MKFVIGSWRMRTKMKMKMKMKIKMKMKMDQGKYSSQSRQLVAG